MPTTDIVPPYVVKCHDCKRDVGRTGRLSESAAGRRCDACWLLVELEDVVRILADIDKEHGQFRTDIAAKRRAIARYKANAEAEAAVIGGAQ